MKQRLILTTVILGISFSTCSQENSNWLCKKLRLADSVLLVSHELTAGIAIIDDRTGKSIPLPKLMISGKPNYKIFKERQIIKDTSLVTLTKILGRPFQGHTIEVSMCFMPHHAILIFHNGKTSYFDICFSCRQFITSKDLEKISAFDNQKWAELEDFFLTQGFKYELSASSQ